jgi:D-xylono/L-arabinono-1,4-lactonase
MEEIGMAVGANRSVECVSPGICHLGECPVWHPSLRRLFWTDVLNRRLWSLDPTNDRTALFWEGESQVSGFSFTKSGALALFSDRGVHRLEAPEVAAMQKAAESSDGGDPGRSFPAPHPRPGIALGDRERFNDVTVDPVGRIFAGTLFHPHVPAGTLYRFEAGHDPVPVLHGLVCTNGMTFSLDERFFFHVDSGTRFITRYAYDRTTGEISDPFPFHRVPEGTGVPDGITLDMENHLWVAIWGGSRVVRIDPDGQVVQSFAMPVLQPSSVMFGGTDLDELYVTSACEGADDVLAGRNRDGRFLGGPLYRLRPGVQGRPEWLAQD